MSNPPRFAPRLTAAGLVLVPAPASVGAPARPEWLPAVALVVVALAALVVALLERRRAARVRALESVALRLAGGDETVRASERSGDLGRLGRSLNHLAAEHRIRLEALERERDERERILAHMSDGVALIDPAGRVIRMNRSLAHLLGAPLPADAGTPFNAFARVPELDELIRAARQSRRAIEAELRLWAPEQRFVHATATPLGGADSEAMLLVLHDLSEAERLDRVRQDFVANVSHELRTPLTSLRGYAETLLDGGLEDAENRESFVRVIREQAVRLEALAEDLLSLAQLERPGARPRFERFDLRDLAARQVAAFLPRARAAELELVLAPGEPTPVSADRILIEQVIANLLDNAIKYTDRGRIDVHVTAGTGRAACEVRDTGAGIAETEQSRVFERFYRVDKARARQRGGTGLGLSIVKHIVTLHGGELKLASRLGEGSSFRFEIPSEPVAAAFIP